MHLRILLVTFLICSATAEDAKISFGFIGGVNVGDMVGSEIDYLGDTFGHKVRLIQAGNGGIRIGYALKKWFELEGDCGLPADREQDVIH
ncbi:MAG: hypothetical protein JW863_05370 [Chitinispirillaceae bacterium]|nr:hypothetical protein [Chitinispirillaceae bacterium]